MNGVDRRATISSRYQAEFTSSSAARQKNIDLKLVSEAELTSSSAAGQKNIDLKLVNEAESRQ